MRKANLFLVAGAFILGFFLAGCGKSNSSKHTSGGGPLISRLDWNMKTLVTAYENEGNTEPDWDAPAKRALTEFARTRGQAVDPSEPVYEIISTNCEAAVKAGCDDPMVRYLFIKYCMSQTNAPKTFSDAFDEVQSNMQDSDYPPIRKFYCSLRAYQQFTYTYGYGRNVDFTVGYQLFNDAVSDLVDTLNDPTTPIGEVYDACSEMIYQLPGNADVFQTNYLKIETPLFKNWPDESIPWLLKGQASVLLAWIYRGNGYADTITSEGEKGFEKNLALADKALNRAWRIDPSDARIAVEMLSVELGQGEGRDRMELWFNRAMNDNPDDYEACSAKLNYIEPKWYGSVQDMLQFGRECVQNTNWGGTVPLVLVDAHYAIYNQFIDPSAQTNYWKQPYVWDDISSAYERYFQNYPNDAGRIAYYARYAYYGEQWDKLNQLIPKISPNEYYLFGGQEKFDEIAALAKQRAAQN